MAGFLKSKKKINALKIDNSEQFSINKKQEKQSLDNGLFDINNVLDNVKNKIKMMPDSEQKNKLLDLISNIPANSDAWTVGNYAFPKYIENMKADLSKEEMENLRREYAIKDIMQYPIYNSPNDIPESEIQRVMRNMKSQEFIQYVVESLDKFGNYHKVTYMLNDRGGIDIELYDQSRETVIVNKQEKQKGLFRKSKTYEKIYGGCLEIEKNNNGEYHLYEKLENIQVRGDDMVKERNIIRVRDSVHTYKDFFDNVDLMDNDRPGEKYIEINTHGQKIDDWQQTEMEIQGTQAIVVDKHSVEDLTNDVFIEKEKKDIKYIDLQEEKELDIDKEANNEITESNNFYKSNESDFEL